MKIKILNWLVIVLTLLLIGLGAYIIYNEFYKTPEPYVSYSIGKPDSTYKAGKPTIKIKESTLATSIIKNFPKVKSGDSSSPAVATLSELDTMIVNGESSISIHIQTIPAVSSITLDTYWEQREKEILRIDTMYISRVDTITIIKGITTGDKLKYIAVGAGTTAVIIGLIQLFMSITK